MRTVVFVGLFFAVITLFAYDTLVQVNAEVPKHVDVSIRKMFSSVELGSFLYEKDLVIEQGVCVDLESNLAGAFEVYFSSPEGERFGLLGDGGSFVEFFLVESKSGRRLSCGDVIYSRERRQKPVYEKLYFDVVIPQLRGDVTLKSRMIGQVGVNIRDV